MRKYLGQGVGVGLSLFLFIGVLGAIPLPDIKTEATPFFLKPFEGLLGLKKISIKVFDNETNLPISRATVLIGRGENKPFANNWMKTDENGEAIFDETLFDEKPKTISIKHPDYSGFTIFRTTANTFRIPLTRFNDTRPQTTISGSFTDWPHMEDFDGTAHVGLFFPSVDILSLISNTNQFMMAPYVKATLYQEVLVAGNLVIPTQEERYMGFISVYVSKPTFTMPFTAGSKQHFMAISGEVPFSKLAKGIIGKKPTLELLSNISPTQMGLVLNQTIPDTTKRIDIPLSLPVSPRYQVTAYNSPKNKDMVFLSLVSLDPKGNQTFPVDIKCSTRDQNKKQQYLNAPDPTDEFNPATSSTMVVALDLDKDRVDHAVTGVIVPTADDTGQYEINSFLNEISLRYMDDSLFTMYVRDVENEQILPNFNLSMISIDTPEAHNTGGTRKIWWTVMTPPTMTRFKLPRLPEKLTDLPALQDNEQITWVANRLSFDDMRVNFDYNGFNGNRVIRWLSRFSKNTLVLAKSLE